jgi:hypothetical protein
MAKFCSNGHQMEDSWEICPYCQRTGFAGLANPSGWFVAMDGGQKGEDFRVRDGQNILGSGSEADIVINDATISSRHASLRYKDGHFYLTDLDSSNGTYLNTSIEPIAREELRDNDVIRLGAISLKFKCL